MGTAAIPRHQQGLIMHSTIFLYSGIRAKKEDEIRAKMEIKALAQSFANALATIGKFIIKKKVGDKDQIYGRWVVGWWEVSVASMRACIMA
jgi:hypothetical protein